MYFADQIPQLEQAIAADPTNLSNYWHLGLIQLLNQAEAEAQTTWMAALIDSDDPEQAAMELAKTLETAIADLSHQADRLSDIWLIRRHLRELLPDDVNNLLHLIPLSAQLGQLSEADLIDWDLTAILQASAATPTTGGTIEPALIEQVVQTILEQLVPTNSVLESIAALARHLAQPQQLMRILIPQAIQLGYTDRQMPAAIHLTQLYLTWDPDNTEALAHLAMFYQNIQMYDQGIAIARHRHTLTTDLPDRAFSNHLLLRGLLGAGGYWDEAMAIFQQQEELLLQIATTAVVIRPVDASRLLSCNYYLTYFRDDFKRQRQIQNALLAKCQTTFQAQNPDAYTRYQIAHRSRQTSYQLGTATNGNDRRSVVEHRPLRIGYLAHTMRRHSVGWLARGLIQHHDRGQFQLYGYFINPLSGDNLQDWYQGQFDHVRSLSTGEPASAMAEQIFQDGIDILIDLDSITLDTSCAILALKPAPIQVTWLGWDAAGLPTIDYYIADNYVLTDDAPAHYCEKIWRMPHSYVAIDGFEIGIPTLRRDQLDIPAEAIIYLSAQRGYKRHADTVRLQMEIIRQVPNSYFLIKGFADQESIQQFFVNIAQEIGVDPARLRFLPDVPEESIHRANLAIADIILDTYPYNGATTTLEALWMERPLVTRVGEQFVARNSYTMLKNVGVVAGMAFSDAEYIEWGVRLGRDHQLRQAVAWQLQQAKRSAPLWNAIAFTQAMEQAYRSMWALFLAPPTDASSHQFER